MAWGVNERPTPLPWGEGYSFTSSPKLGFSMGGALKLKGSGRTSFEIQLLYSYNRASYAYKYSDNNLLLRNNGDQAISFIDVPLLVAYRLPARLVSHLKAGVMPSKTVVAKAKNRRVNTMNQNTTQWDWDGKNSSFFKSSDIAVVAGAEVGITRRFGLEFRFTRGLRNLFKERRHDEYDETLDYLGTVKRSTGSIFLVLYL